MVVEGSLIKVATRTRLVNIEYSISNVGCYRGSGLTNPLNIVSFAQAVLLLYCRDGQMTNLLHF